MLHTFNPTILTNDIYYQILTLLPQSALIIDQDYRILFANEKCKEVFLETNDVIERYIWEINSHLSENGLIQFIENAFGVKGVSSVSSFYYVKKLGKESWWDIAFTPINYQDNVYLLITADNVTQKYLAKKMSDEKTLKLESILQNLGSALILYNEHGEKLYANHSFSSLCTKDHTGMVTLSDLEELYEFYDFNGVKLNIQDLPFTKSLAGEFVQNFKLKLVHKESAESLYYIVHTKPIYFNSNHQRNFIMLMSDVSRELQDDQNRSEFIQIAAHELRTPLTSIKGFTQLVLERYREREKKWFFQPTMNLLKELERDQLFFKVIMDEAIRLDELTNELLSIFKIDQGRLELDIQLNDMDKVVLDALDEYMIPNDFHQIHYSNLASTTKVNIDYKQIKRVIHNFISNAVKYSPSSADIYIKVENTNGNVLFSVRDEGIGIPKEQQHRIFERFFRAHSKEHEEITGFGVGLHICQEIIRQHKGQISFESEYGKGSTFYFLLPTEP